MSDTITSDAVNLDAIKALMEKQQGQETVPEQKASTPASTGGFSQGGGNFKNKNPEDMPNIFTDNKIEPLEVDKTKLKSSYAYTVLAAEENPPVDLTEALNKIVEYLKVKRYSYRYNGDNRPGLSFDMLKKQDLSMVDSYQVFLPWGDKSGFDLPEAVVTQKRASLLAGRIAKHYTKFTKKDPENPEVKITEYFFSKMPGAIRTRVANNIHMYLGKDCNTKLSFVILYSAGGEEKKEDIVIDKTARTTRDCINICSDLGIKIFNIGKKDGMKELLEFVEKL